MRGRGEDASSYQVIEVIKTPNEFNKRSTTSNIKRSFNKRIKKEAEKETPHNKPLTGLNHTDAFSNNANKPLSEKLKDTFTEMRETIINLQEENKRIRALQNISDKDQIILNLQKKLSDKDQMILNLQKELSDKDTRINELEGINEQLFITRLNSSLSPSSPETGSPASESWDSLFKLVNEDQEPPRSSSKSPP